MRRHLIHVARTSRFMVIVPAVLATSVAGCGAPVDGLGKSNDELSIRGTVSDRPIATAPVAVLLERHGAVAVASSNDGAAAIAQAVDRLELVEVLCRTWRDALMVRAGLASGAIVGAPLPVPQTED
jgi:hypothetical protein